MLQNRIATANVLLILVMLIAKVCCQLDNSFERVPMDDPNQELDVSRSKFQKLSGRQLNPKFNLDLMQFNTRNAMVDPSVSPRGNDQSGLTNMKVKISPAQEPAPVPSPTPLPMPQSAPKPSDTSASLPATGDNLAVKDKGNDEMAHALHKLIQQLYVAQAQVQLEANEIQRAQAVAAAAQQYLEEASNNVRVITAALHAAQQTVAAAAIRAQTAQLQLAAHDQLLFAARQRVDALSAQIVSMKAEEGIQPTKMIVDLQALLNKLKEPLPDNQKPTPIPSILGDSGAAAATTGPIAAAGFGQAKSNEFTTAATPRGKGQPCAYSYFPNQDLTHYDEKSQRKVINDGNDDRLDILLRQVQQLGQEDEKTPQKSLNEERENRGDDILRQAQESPHDDENMPQKPVNEEKETNLADLIKKANNLIEYSDSLLKENSDENNEHSEALPDENRKRELNSLDEIASQGIPDESIRKELSGLNENEIRDLVDFVLSMHHEQQLDSNNVFAKPTDQKYINDFLNTIQNSQLRDEPRKNLPVNEVITVRKSAPEKGNADGYKSFGLDANAQPKENENNADVPIFNLEKAFEINSENFQESLP